MMVELQFFSINGTLRDKTIHETIEDAKLCAKLQRFNRGLASKCFRCMINAPDERIYGEYFSGQFHWSIQDEAKNVWK